VVKSAEMERRKMNNPNGKTDWIAARLLLPLDTTEVSLDLVGGKGRALAAMASAGMPVPDGFHLTTSAYRRFVTENDLQRAILDLAKPAVVEGKVFGWESRGFPNEVRKRATSVSFESAAVAIQALFEQADLPSGIIAEIHQAYDALNERGQAPAVAVRSSANSEDLPHPSFAGQHDTYLNVRGLNALVSEPASMVLKVEQHFEGVPQDIEWAVADGQLWLLQSRPITNLPPAPLKDIEWELPEDMPEWAAVLARRKLSEHVPGPVSPLFGDVYVDGAF